MKRIIPIIAISLSVASFAGCAHNYRLWTPDSSKKKIISAELKKSNDEREKQYIVTIDYDRTQIELGEINERDNSKLEKISDFRRSYSQYS